MKQFLVILANGNTTWVEIACDEDRDPTRLALSQIKKPVKWAEAFDLAEALPNDVRRAFESRAA